MVHSLESRTPMIDNHLIEFSLNIPPEIKLEKDQLKAIIKESSRDWLPESLYRLPKRGFPTPLRFWLRGPLQDINQEEGWFLRTLTPPPQENVIKYSC